VFSFDLSRIELEDLIERTIGLYHPLVEKSKKDLLIFCEHPNTLSLGKNFKGFSEGELPLEQWQKRDFSVVECDRGGQATIHVPGHLMIYPVVNLKNKNLGIKKFIEILLGAIVSALSSIGINSFIDSERLGVWIDLGEQGSFKIASLGLRVDRGITRHGASIYIEGDMEPFRWFSPCGDRATRTISIKNIHENSDLLLRGMDFSSLKYILMGQISNNLRSALENI